MKLRRVVKTRGAARILVVGDDGTLFFGSTLEFKKNFSSEKFKRWGILSNFRERGQNFL